jgi:hypothetical protein
MLSTSETLTVFVSSRGFFDATDQSTGRSVAIWAAAGGGGLDHSVRETDCLGHLNRTANVQLSVAANHCSQSHAHPNTTPPERIWQGREEKFSKIRRAVDSTGRRDSSTADEADKT